MPKNLKTSLIVDLLGNVSAKSREWSRDMGAFGRSSKTALGGVSGAARGVGNSFVRMGGQSRQALSSLRGGLRQVSGDLDRLKHSAGEAVGKISGLYGLLTGGAAAYGFKHMFLDPAAKMEGYRVRITSLNHGNAAATDQTMKWAQKNTQEAPWSLNQILEEYAVTRGYGMSDAQSRAYIQMLEDQAGRHGWNHQQIEGASLQLREMFARGKLQGQDANILSTYGINAYQVLAGKLKVPVAQLRKLGEKGKLGPDAIRLLYQTLTEQGQGAAKRAMSTWSGMTSRMKADWDQFALKVMDAGPFKLMEKQLGGVLDTIAQAQASGQLDGLATDVGNGILWAFTQAQQGVTTFLDALKKVQDTLKQLRDAGYGKAMDEFAEGAKTAAKYLLYVYLAQKAIQVSAAVGKGAFRLAATPFRYAWGAGRAVTSPFRRKTPGEPGAPLSRSQRFYNFLSGVNPAAVQPVFVTNWPAGGFAGAGGGEPFIDGGDGGRGGKRRKKRGPGRGRTPKSRLGGLVSAGEELAESAAKPGLFGRLWGATKRGLGKIPGAGMAARVFGQGGALGRGLSAMGSKFGWLGKAGGMAGRLFGRLGGPLLSAVTAAPVLLDGQATAHDKGDAIGAVAGTALGGALGSLAGPLGTAIGSTLGSYLGGSLGGWLGDVYHKWTTDDDKKATPQAQKSTAQIELTVPDGFGVRSVDINDSDPFGLDLNVFNGSNYVPY
ncbi:MULTISPECIES: tape measure protein [Serratia]|uniref:tape measure protein n=1 Tax=Serratia TaxID=613 RepID=UPI00065F952F|nr:tape measure protein [Serratia sp. 506_PEND]